MRGALCPLTLAARHSRCKRLAAEGDLSRACTALTAPPVLAPSPDTLSSLQAKHPQAPLPDLDALGPPRPGAVPDFDTQAVAEAGFKRGSAPGPSGLRADHLHEALPSAHADEVVTWPVCVSCLRGVRRLPPWRRTLPGPLCTHFLRSMGVLGP